MSYIYFIQNFPKQVFVVFTFLHQIRQKTENGNFHKRNTFLLEKETIISKNLYLLACFD